MGTQGRRRHIDVGVMLRRLTDVGMASAKRPVATMPCEIQGTQLHNILHRSRQLVTAKHANETRDGTSDQNRSIYWSSPTRLYIPIQKKKK